MPVVTLCQELQVVSSTLPAMAVPCPGPALRDGPRLSVDHSWELPWGQCELDMLERECGSKRDRS